MGATGSTGIGAGATGTGAGAGGIGGGADGTGADGTGPDGTGGTRGGTRGTIAGGPPAGEYGKFGRLTETVPPTALAEDGPGKLGLMYAGNISG